MPVSVGRFLLQGLQLETTMASEKATATPSFALRTGAALLIALLCAVSACDADDATAPSFEGEYILGSFSIGGLPPQLSVTASGNTVTVEVRTWGTTCVAKGSLWFDADRSERRLTVSPMDLFVPSRHVCETLGVPFHHRGSIELEDGRWVVIIRGRAPGARAGPIETLRFTVDVPGE